MPVKLDVALRLPLKLSQVFGLFPYDCRTMVKSLWSISTVALVLLISANLSVTMNSGNPLNMDAFITCMFRILSVIPWLSSSVLLLRSFTIRPGIIRVVNRIQMVERRFHAYSDQCSFRVPFMVDFTVRTVIVLCEIYAAHVLVRGKPIEQFAVRFVGFYVTHYIQNVYELQFLSIVHLLANWFRSLTERLTLKNAAASLECYSDLSAACFELNETFKVQNLMTVSNCVLLCVVDCYVFQTTSAGLMSPVGLNTILRVILRIYQLCVFMLSTANLTKQVKVKEHFRQRITTSFTGWDMFSLEKTQLHSIATLIVNYLIILVQFGGDNHLL